MTITITQADTYFGASAHLSSARWLALSSAQKTAAITMAEKDVLAILQGTEIVVTAQETAAELAATNLNILAAVCEQALFLFDNYAKIERYDEAISKSVEGLGSETFAQKTRFTGISRRAMQFISRVLNDGTVRLARG